MASRLRPTPETGTVAATKMPASSVGPSWAQRGSREARLAFRQAQRRGDREGAMRIAMGADKAGLASQASIGSAEERLAGEYQGRGADTAVTAEIGAALTPPGPGRADGQPRITMDMRRGDPGFQEQPSQTPAGADFNRGGMIGMVMNSARQNPVFREKVSAARAAYERIKDGGIDPKTGRRLVDESEVGPSISEQPPAPGASQPPENPVSGSSTPVTGDPESRLGIRRGSFALQGLAGRQALSENLRKSIAAGGGDLSGDRLKRAKAEADRLGVTPEQFLGELQDIGVSVPDADMKTLLPQDNRSLDQRLRDYQDKYLGGGPSSELTSRLRTDAAANQSAAESMRRARERPATPPPSPAPAAPTAPTRLAPPSRASVLGGSPTAPPSPAATPNSLAYRFGQAARQLSPASLAGRVAAGNRDAARSVATTAAGAAVQGVRQVQGVALDAAGVAAAPIVEARNRVAEFAGDKVLDGLRRRRRLADFVRGIRTPQS